MPQAGCRSRNGKDATIGVQRRGEPHQTISLREVVIGNICSHLIQLKGKQSLFVKLLMTIYSLGRHLCAIWNTSVFIYLLASGGMEELM